ncbi:hypothetical protein MHYP_G00240270, partial [Metynnis hypsauchen]
KGRARRKCGGAPVNGIYTDGRTSAVFPWDRKEKQRKVDFLFGLVCKRCDLNRDREMRTGAVPRRHA